MLAIDFDIGDIVFEDGWDINLLQAQHSVLFFGYRSFIPNKMP